MPDARLLRYLAARFRVLANQLPADQWDLANEFLAMAEELSDLADGQSKPRDSTEPLDS